MDITDAEADYLLATHDPLGAMAGADNAMLSELLRQVNSGDAAVQALLAGLLEIDEAVPVEAPEDFQEFDE
ncbi:hypothetical protein RZS08_28535, partial [Arthrospira platensis SPKY1]|nr:hypothetical protein [Arthrospira platensis SPKY1]